MSKTKVAIVVADFYADIAEAMLAHCRSALLQDGAEVLSVSRVSGALEIPYALNFLANQKSKPTAMIALGCVIRGETYHFELVANTCAQGILQVQLAHNIPIANGVLTVENMEQAKARIKKSAAQAARASVSLADINSYTSAD